MLGLVSLIFMVTGFLIGERQGLLIGFLLALGINYLAYHYSNMHWLDYFRATQLEGQDPWGLIELSRHMAIKARVPEPKIFLIRSDFPTAFSVGRSVRNSSIVVSEGLLKYLSYEELEAVIACEISKIRRLDTLNIGVISGLTAPFFIFCKILDGFITAISFGVFKGRRFAHHACELAMQILAKPIVGQKSFYESDYHAGMLLKSPEQLAKVLWKLKNYAATRKLKIPPHAAPFLTVDPLTNDGQHRYFHVQPSVDSRIERLVGRFPI